MACLISYELVSREKDHRPFLSELEACCRRVLPTTWVTAKERTKEDVMKALWPLMDHRDRLLVVEIADRVGVNLLA